MQDTISVHLSIGISHIRKHLSLYFFTYSFKFYFCFFFLFFSFLFPSFFFFLSLEEFKQSRLHASSDVCIFQFLSCWLDWLPLRLFPFSPLTSRGEKYIMIDLSGLLSLIFTSSSWLTSLCQLALQTLLTPFSSSYISKLVFPNPSTWNPSPLLQVIDASFQSLGFCLIHVSLGSCKH